MARLAVTSPIKFTIGNYLFYNGTLILVPLLITAPDRLRLWYLAVQIGLVMILKVLDYSMRDAYSLDRRTRLVAYGAAGLAPLPAMAIYPNIVGPLLFYAGYFGLIRTAHYLKN